MRTTIRLDEDLLRRARQRALERGSSLSGFVEEAVRAALAARARAGAAEAPALPVSRVAGRGLQPGVDLDDTDTLLDVMNGLR